MIRATSTVRIRPPSWPPAPDAAAHRFHGDHPPDRRCGTAVSNRVHPNPRAGVEIPAGMPRLAMRIRDRALVEYGWRLRTRAIACRRRREKNRRARASRKANRR